MIPDAPVDEMPAVEIVDRPEDADRDEDHLAPDGVDIALPPPRPFESWTVGDGTEALLVEDHRVPLVTVQVRVPVGTWSAAFRALGAEEAWNNLAFDPDGALRARADALGANLTARAGPLECTAWISSLAEDAPAAVDLLRDVLLNRAFDRAELRRDTRNARIAYRTSEREPRFLLRRLVDDLHWASTDPRALDTRPPERTVRDPERLARAADRVLAHPGRIVGLSGDLDRAEAEDLVARLDLPAAGVPIDAPTYAEIRTPGPGPHLVAAPEATQVYFSWTRPSLAYTDPAYPALRVAALVLGQSGGSRLSRALRRDDGDTYGVAIALGAGDVPGVLQVFTYTRTDNADALAAKFGATLAAFAADGITEAERREALGALRGRELFALQAPEGRISQVAWARLHGTSVDFSREVLEAASALSLDEINAFVAEFFRPEAFTEARAVPE